MKGSTMLQVLLEKLKVGVTNIRLRMGDELQALREKLVEGAIWLISLAVGFNEMLSPVEYEKRFTERLVSV